MPEIIKKNLEESDDEFDVLIKIENSIAFDLGNTEAIKKKIRKIAN